MSPEHRPRRAVPRLPRQIPVPPEHDLPLDIDVHSLTGAYAVDALDDLERARFEQHLSTCTDCAAEVRTFTETTARLGGSQSLAPPPGMRDAVLAEIARTRQLPPGPAPRVDGAPGASRSSSRWFAVAAASLLVAAAGLGGVALDAQRDANRLEETTAALTGVLADPDRQVMDADFAGGHATVMVSGEEVVLVGSGVQAPPSDAVYVLWMLDEAGSPRAAGVLEPTGEGRFIAQTTGYRPGETMAITVEEDPETTLPHGDVVMTTA